MKEERSKQIDEVLKEHREKMREKHESPDMMINVDPISKEISGKIVSELGKDSQEIKKLEELGFKVIYPAELPKEKVEKMDISERYVYDRKMKEPLIIDEQETSRSSNFAEMISNHYLSAENSIKTTSPRMWGIDNKSINTNVGVTVHKEETTEKLMELLGSVGFEPTLEGEGYLKNIKIQSDIQPYPVVKKSKFEQIYDKSKGKIKEVFAKLKGLVNSKDKTKENDQNER